MLALSLKQHAESDDNSVPRAYLEMSSAHALTPQVTENIGAGEGIRTLDPNLGKVVLYP